MVEARNTPHRACIPIPAKSASTRSSPLVVSIGEFSTTTSMGLTSRMIRAISTQSPLRSPSIPAPAPHWLMSWHGNPPVMTCTWPRHGLPSNVRTSSQIGNAGSKPSRCLSSRICLAPASNSTAQAVRHPSSFAARMLPPPLQKVPAHSFSARKFAGCATVRTCLLRYVFVSCLLTL